jgi:glycosyltransferase involved in cell wall biosynthesis
MSNEPLISIITINYNDKNGLERTFNSVFKQSHQDFEYVVIDGGSTDGSVEVIEKNQDKISYWVSEKDKGIYNAMNKGIVAAKGTYLLFLNSGDHLYADETLALSVPYLQNKAKDMYYGNILVRDGIKDVIHTYPEQLTLDYLFYHSLSHPTTFIKKSRLLEMNLYDENLKIASDWKFFMIGILIKGFTHDHLNEIVSVFYRDGISSTNTELLNIEKEQVLTTEFPLFYKEFKKLKRYKQISDFYHKSRVLHFFQKLKIIKKV